MRSGLVVASDHSSFVIRASSFPTFVIRHSCFRVLLTLVVVATITLSRALARRFDRHKKIARWTLPIWLYVSVTGVVVYVMLYHLWPPANL